MKRKQPKSRLLPAESERRIIMFSPKGELLARIDAIAEREGIAARSKAIASLVELGASLYERLAEKSGPIDAYATQERVAHVEALARLVELGLKVVERVDLGEHRKGPRRRLPKGAPIPVAQ